MFLKLDFYIENYDSDKIIRGLSKENQANSSLIEILIFKKRKIFINF